MSHEELSALCGPYALGALDGEEQQTLADHLPDCWECRQRVLEFEETFAEGAKVLPPIQPSAKVKTGIMQRISGPQQALPVAPPSANGTISAATAATWVLAALILGAVGASLLTSRPSVVPTAPPRRLITLLGEPGLGSADLQGEGVMGRVVWSQRQLAVVAELPPPRLGESYALWSLGEPQPQLLGRIDLGSGYAILARAGAGQAFAISRESDAGPLPAPAGPIVLQTP